MPGWTLAVCAVLVGGGVTLDGAPAVGVEDRATVAQGVVLDTTTYRAVSRPSERRGLAFPIRGRVAEVFVEPGDVVSAGAPLIRLEDRLERASLRLAKIRAEDDSTVRAAEETVLYRQEELELTKQSRDGGGASSRDLRDAEFNLVRAELDLRAAHVSQAEAIAEYELETARVAELMIRAPFAGDVLAVSKREGEGVDELTAVVTVVAIDPLELEVNVPPAVALRVRPGLRARVTWEDLPEAGASEGEVVFRAAAGHAGARQIPVRLEVPNPDRLPSGLHALVTFEWPEDAAGWSPGGLSGGAGR